MNVGAQLGTPFPRYVPQVGSYAMPGYAVPGYMMTSQPMAQVDDQVSDFVSFFFLLNFVSALATETLSFAFSQPDSVYANGSTNPSI